MLESPIIWPFFLAILCCYGWNTLAKRLKRLNVPSIDVDLFGDNRSSLQDAFDKYIKAGQAYRLPAAHHDYIMLPPELMSEINPLPEEQVSFTAEFFDRFNGKYTGMGGAVRNIEPSFVKTVSCDLTRNLGRILPEVIDECYYAFPENLGEPSGWTPITIHPKVVRMVALLTSRVFIGLPVCRDEKWLQVMIYHIAQIFIASEQLWRYPRWLRGIVAPFLKSIKDLRANLEKTRDMIKPQVEKRLEELANLPPNGKRPNDTLQWLMKNAPPEKANDIVFHASEQLSLSVASIHNTGMNITQNLLDLATYTEYQDILRTEFLDTLRQQDTTIVSKQTLTKLRKLDSFMRESQRVTPDSLISQNRKITAPHGITLSNSLHIPEGIFVTAPSGQLCRDPTVHDNPDQFDGLRFYRLRQKPGNESKHQFVTTNSQNLIFGHGKHACPGRFFASNEIKIFLLYTLLNYEMRLPDGKTERPTNIMRGVTCMPDPTVEIEFRKRSSEVKLTGAMVQ